jgi:hypothetical protein
MEAWGTAGDPPEDWPRTYPTSIHDVTEQDRIGVWGTVIDFPTWQDKIAALCSDPERFGYLWREVTEETCGDYEAFWAEVNAWNRAHR